MTKVHSIQSNGSCKAESIRNPVAASRRSSTSPTPSTLDLAQAYRRAGFSIIPVKCDGTKAPQLCSWDEFKERRASRAEVDAWFDCESPPGIGIVGGEVSGGLLVIDFEYLDFFEEWRALVESQVPGLVARLPLIKTPGKDDAGGRHVYARTSGPAVATGKLARITRTEAERRTGDPGRTTAVEVKAEKGYVLTVGCPPDCHTTGRLYEHVEGPPIVEVPTLDEAEVSLLLACARALERGDKASADRRPERAGSDSNRPGDDFNRRANWDDVLPAGWEIVRQAGDVKYLRRPGKDEGVSATIGHCRSERAGPKLYVFSTNAEPFEADRSYSLFEAYTLVNHGGDFKAAARDLAGQGYGDRLANRPRHGTGQVSLGDQLVLEHEPAGGRKQKVTVRRGKRPVHIHTIDAANATQRQRFCKDLAGKLPDVDLQAVEAELLSAAYAAKESAPADDGEEIDVSRLVRPDQFFTAEVSGTAVPVVRQVDGKASARWELYLRWADGRRERRPLPDSLDLPDETTFLFHPIPGDPSLNTPPGWSAASRQRWLRTAKSPDPAEVFRRICDRITRFVELPQDVATGTAATLALWTMLTYVYQGWDSVPYLFVGGPMASGKTTLFGILQRLVFRPLGSSNLTAPALFRTLHDRGGTLLFDEAERLRQSTPDQQEVLSMLLAGYRRGGKATRLEPVGDGYRPVDFDVYAPKALACIAGLPPALASRCIPVAMFRAGPDSPKPRRRLDAVPGKWRSLRDALHVLALEHGPDWLELAGRSDVAPEGLDGRNYELWQPLLALASWVEVHGEDGLLELVQRHALDSVADARDDAIPDADETLLEILAEEMLEGNSPTPGEILAAAQQRDQITFTKWTPRTVSNRLKVYGIAARKFDRRREFRDTTLGDLARIQRHYGIDLGISDPAPPASSRCVPVRPKEDGFGFNGVESGRTGTHRDGRDAAQGDPDEYAAGPSTEPDPSRSFSGLPHGRGRRERVRRGSARRDESVDREPGYDS